jgi:glutathione S-transferase
MAQPALTLFYFDIHGLGARCRLAAKVGGVALTDHRFADRDAFAALKADGTLPFGQVPLLRVGAGAESVAIGQSSAILRYLCRAGGLHPEDALKAAAVDAALAAEADAFAGYSTLKYRDRSGLAPLDDAAVAACEKVVNTDVFPRHLAHLERLLARSASGWVADTARPAACDFAWGTALQQLRTGGFVFLDAATLLPDKFPACCAFLDKFLALPEVKEYYGL